MKYIGYIRYGYVSVAPNPALKLYQPLLSAPEPPRHNKIHDQIQPLEVWNELDSTLEP